MSRTKSLSNQFNIFDNNEIKHTVSKLKYQTKLHEQFSKYTATTLPKSILLLGETGCGKHTFCKEIANKLGLDLVYLTPSNERACTLKDSEKRDELKANITPEKLIEYQQSPIQKIYLIDLKVVNLNVNGQKLLNRLLKFIEEPSPAVNIVLLAESEIGILDTILNRCQVYHFEPYTIEQLKDITKVEDTLACEICQTPGMLLDPNIDKTTIPQIANLCQRIITGLHKVPVANAVSIYTKINCKEDYNKFDFNLFFNTLSYVSFNEYKFNKNELAFLVYEHTVKARQQLLLSNGATKEYFMITFLENLWEDMYEYSRT